jgi:hypothetical protein
MSLLIARPAGACIDHHGCVSSDPAAIRRGEPEWTQATSWLWLPVAGLVTVYLVTMLVAWCVDGIQNVGMGDARVPVLVVLAVASFLGSA